MLNLSKEEIIKIIIDDVEKDLKREEILHTVLNKKLSKNITEEKITLGNRAADALARFAGSWKFITGFALVLGVWIVANTIILKKSFDPFPFILLNLMLSCLAAIQAPVIMMSQNRQEAKDRERSENDYIVNLKTEIIIEDMHDKLDKIIENQTIIFESLNKTKNKNDV